MTYAELVYVIIYSGDGGKHWRLGGDASSNRDDVLREMARVQREQPLFQYAVKCLDSQLWQAVQAREVRQ